MVLTEQIDHWYREGAHECTIEAIHGLPASERTDGLLGELAVAYNNTGEYPKAMVVLEEMRPRLGFTWRWQYRMGYALYYSAEKSSDPGRAGRLLSKAQEAFLNALRLGPPKLIRQECLEFLQWIREEQSQQTK